MKIFGFILGLLTYSTALAQTAVIPNNTVAIGKTGAANKTIEFNLTKAGASANPKVRWNNSSSKIQFSNDGTTFSDMGAGGGSSSNILTNGGFETSTTDWTASGGTLTTSTTAADVFELTTAGTWDSSSASQTLTYAIQAVKGLGGTNGEMTCMIRVPSGTATHTMGVWDGSTLTQAQTIINTSTDYVSNTINFVFPASGNSVGVRFTSVNANEPLIDIDACYVGPARNLSNVSQSVMAGSSYFAGTTSCTWTRSSTTIGAFSTTAACPGPTIESSTLGTWATTDSDLPRQTVTNLPAGKYLAEFSGVILNGGGTAQVMAIYDGSTTCYADNTNQGTGAVNQKVSCVFEYTSPQSSRSFELYTASASSTVTLQNSSTSPASGSKFKLIYYPTSSQLAVVPSQQNYDWTSYTPTFTGFGTVTSIECQHKREGSDQLIRCKATAGTTTGTEARVTLGGGVTSAGVSKIPTIQKAGELIPNGAAAVSFGMLIEPGVGYLTFGMQDASRNGLTKRLGNDFSSSTVFSFTARVPIEGWIQTNANPAIVGQVSSNTTWQERVEHAYVNGSVGSPTFADVTRQSGSWLTALTNNSTGNNTLTIASGIFSSTPDCQCTCYNEFIGTNQCSCSIDTTTAPSATAIRIQTNAAGNTAAGRDFSIMCMGPR